MTADDANALTLDEVAGQLASAAEADTQGKPAAEDEVETTTEETPAEGEPEATVTKDDETETTDQSKAETEEPEKIKVTLKDGTETTVEELAKSYYREADYTRDKQAIHAGQREFVEKFVPQANERLKRLDTYIETFETLIGKEPDPDADPIGFAEWAKKDKLLANARKEADQLNQANFSRARQTALSELASGKIFDDWKDADSLNKGLVSLQEYALAEGFTPQDLAGLADPRLYKALEKARRYDAGQAVKTKLVKAVGVTAAVKPGVKSAQGNLKQKGVETAQKRFAQTKSSKDALEYLTRLAS